jgi:aerobic C4-dicarboxylate transport protein
VFLAQATNTHLTLSQQIGIVAVLLLASKRFMGEAPAVTNLAGNSVATIVIAKWEGALDEERMRNRLSLKRRNST